MKQIQAIIVDDEKDSCDILKQKIEKYCLDIAVVGIANNVVEAQSLIHKVKPQLLFLDIEMPERSGFDLLLNLEQRFEFDVIFVTAYNQYAMEAFKANGTSYLLKPFTRSDSEKSDRYGCHG